jgi:hypothetical protein
MDRLMDIPLAIRRINQGERNAIWTTGNKPVGG